MPVRFAGHPAGRAFAVLVLGALVLSGCGSSAPALTDPGEILQKGAASLGAMTSFHLRGTVDGEVPLSLGGVGGGGTGGGAGGGSGGGVPVPLDGTTLDGDVDVAGRALAVELIAPALLNLRVNVVVAGGSAYLKLPLVTGKRWVRQPAGGGIGADPTTAIAGLVAFLARPERGPEKLPDTRCSGTDCYSVRFTVPAGEVRDALGSLGSAIPGLSADVVGDVVVTVGVRRDDLRLATLGLDLPAGGAKPLAISLEISKVNEAVTITPPPADQVDAPPGA